MDCTNQYFLPVLILQEREVFSVLFLFLFQKATIGFLFLFLLEKTNSVLILTKCVLHMCEAPFLPNALPKGLACCFLGFRPAQVVPTSPTLAQPSLALRGAATGQPDGWPLRSQPSQLPPPWSLQTPWGRIWEALHCPVGRKAAGPVTW